jgi:flagellar motor switch protein FliN/FliY
MDPELEAEDPIEDAELVEPSANDDEAAQDQTPTEAELATEDIGTGDMMGGAAGLTIEEAMPFVDVSGAADLPGPAHQDVMLQPLEGGAATGPPVDEDLTLVLDVPVELSVEMGRATMTIRETLAIGTGTIITLNRVVGEAVDLFANGRLIGRGEVIAIDEEYGLRVTEVLATPSSVSKPEAA